MNDRIENKPGQSEQAYMPCRVAYTLNNAQPVSCTIIGSQPLFYMDYAPDEDDSLESMDLRMLENEIQTLKRQIENFDKPAFHGPKRAALDIFADGKDAFLKSETHGESASPESILTQSRLGAALVSFARSRDVQITMSAQGEDGFYDARSNRILINPGLVQAEQVLLLVRELRRLWQHAHGALAHALAFQPDHAILINRLREADMSALMIRAAWELQLAGYKDAWERIENSPLADLGRAFAREAFLDFRTLNNGQACAAVFEAWFLSERCRHADKKLIQQMLADHKGLVFGSRDNAQIITTALIGALGEMPFGKNYLSPHAAALLEDPLFSEVRDRSNANFLWFIKFECSFRETEQELQGSFAHAAEGIKPSAFPKSDIHGRHSKIPGAADVISLESRRAPSISKQPGLAGGGADIIDLRQWSKK